MPRPTALYKISGAVKTERSELVKVNSQGIRDFVLTAINAAVELDKDIIDRVELTNALKERSISASNSMISRRIQELEALGCIDVRSEYKTVDGRKRKCTVHEFISLSGLIKHLNKDPSHSPAPQGRPRINDLVVYSEILEGEGIIKLDADGDIVPYTEGAFSILESAARSRSDKETEIRCRYYIRKDDMLEITAATSTKAGSGIMYSSDQRIIHTLNGMLRQANDEKLQADLFPGDYPAKLLGDYCFFDIYALTREIGLASNIAENRQNVRRMIERLKDTTYSVDATHSQFWRERYMPSSSFTKADYRYITEFYTGEDWVREMGKESELPIVEDRFFVVRFHPLILNAMTTPKMSFVAHDSLKRERLDIVHRLNNWAKPVIGVRPKPVGQDHHQYTLDIFHQRVKPASRLDNFERQFYNMAKRQDIREKDEPHEESVRFSYDADGNIASDGVFWLNGYYYRIENNDDLAQEIYRKTRTVRKRRKKSYPVITVWRDRKDEIVGDNSDHNLALRRQAKTLIDLTETGQDEFSLPDTANYAFLPG